METAHQASDSGSPIRVAALVAYNGGAYNGFQLQVGVPTVQGALETALARCVGIRLEAGKTPRTELWDPDARTQVSTPGAR